MLLFDNRVDEAAVMVMSAEPLKEVPLMFLAVARTVAAPAVKLAPVPVMFVPTRADGVPRAGVTRVGELERTTEPVPVEVVTPVPPEVTGKAFTRARVPKFANCE